MESAETTADSPQEAYQEPSTRNKSESAQTISEIGLVEGFPEVFRNMLDKLIDISIKRLNTFFPSFYETVYCWDSSDFGARFNFVRQC